LAVLVALLEKETCPHKHASFLGSLRFSKRPVIAVVCAVLFSAIPFGLGHGGTFLENLLITGLLYGLPMAVIFVRRDWEHAVGAHYMINMIPTLMVFLET
jgi:membrane protease YdiL (CAAX protease family)